MDVRGRAVVKGILLATVICLTVNLAKSLEEKICFCFAPIRIFSSEKLRTERILSPQGHSYYVRSGRCAPTMIK